MKTFANPYQANESMDLLCFTPSTFENYQQLFVFCFTDIFLAFT